MLLTNQELTLADTLASELSKDGRLRSTTHPLSLALELKAAGLNDTAMRYLRRP